MTDWNTWSFVIEICGNYYYFLFLCFAPPLVAHALVNPALISFITVGIHVCIHPFIPSAPEWLRYLGISQVSRPVPPSLPCAWLSKQSRRSVYPVKYRHLPIPISLHCAHPVILPTLPISSHQMILVGLFFRKWTSGFFVNKLSFSFLLPKRPSAC